MKEDIKAQKSEEKEAKTINDWSKEEKEAFWHSTSHILADAVKRIWPEVKLGIGPAIEEGFFYDFEKKEPFTAEDLVRIESEMKKIINENLKFENIKLSRKEAEKCLKDKDEKYKLELLNELPDKEVSFNKHGAFMDLCNGKMIRYSKQIKALKLTNSTTAYWKGDSKNPMMQRIYGISFPSKKDLEAHFFRIEEAKKRDHVVLGKQLDLFGIYPETVGPGLVHWHPNGARIRILIEDFMKKEQFKAGYKMVITPHIGYEGLWKTSGHLGFYKNSMYAPMEIDEKKYYIKPMNCPFHVQIFKSKMRSYKELPLRMAEFGNVYRYEISGALHGLTRVRGFTQDDAHIFCTPEQVEKEVEELLTFVKHILQSFGFKEYKVFLSTRDPTKSKDFMGSEEMWTLAENTLSSALEKNCLKFSTDVGGAAFYGPKIDIKLLDALGREWQCSTIQFDFNLPEKFDVTYIGDDGAKHRALMVHRALLGSFERFFGLLIEHYAGVFPTWLAPVQVKLLPITERNMAYAEEIQKKLLEEEIRVEIDYSQNTTEYKVRTASLEKVPYMIVLGDKEEEKKTLAVRERGVEKLRFGVTMDSFISEVHNKEKNKQ